MSEAMLQVKFGDFAIPFADLIESGVAYRVCQYKFAHYLSNELSAKVNADLGRKVKEDTTDEMKAERLKLTTNLRQVFVDAWNDGSYLEDGAKEPRAPSVNRETVLFNRFLYKAVRTYMEKQGLEKIEKDVWFSPRQNKNVGIVDWAKGYLANATLGEIRRETINEQVAEQLRAEEATRAAASKMSAMDGETDLGELEI